MAEGRFNHGIATVLVVSDDAVEKHVRHILRQPDIGGAPDDQRRVLAVLAYLHSSASDPPF